jgi:hypothetical protein
MMSQGYRNMEKNRKVFRGVTFGFMLCLIVLLPVLLTSACGRQSSDPAEELSDEQQAVLTPEQEEVDLELAVPDSGSVAEEIMGNWVGAGDDSRFVNIERNGDEFLYEDNEGIFAGTFEKGVLKVKVTDTDVAQAYFDNTTGHLLLVYQDDISEFRRK